MAIFAQDPRRIGALFLGSSLLSAILSLILTVVLRAGDPSGPDWPALVTLHGVQMMVFTLMPALCGGFGLWLLPGQIGARSLAFPRMALLSWALHALSLALAAAALVTRSADAGLAALFLAGMSAILVAINTLTTFLNMRAPGISLGSAPVFAWSLAMTAGLVLMAVPAIAGAGVMAVLGGAADLRQAIRFFSHPLIFVLILPAFGIFTEIVAAFALHGLAGRRVVLAAMGVLAGFGVTLWLQELFAHGYTTDKDAFFGLAATALIPPALVIVATWCLSLARGIRQWSAPLGWAVGFILLMAGAGLLSVQGDGMARFHYALGLGAVFGAFGGFYFWLPKLARRRIPDGAGHLHAGLMFAGVQLSFLPPLLGGTEVWETAGGLLSCLSFALFLGITVRTLRSAKVEDAPWGPLPGPEWQERDQPAAATLA